MNEDFKEDQLVDLTLIEKEKMRNSVRVLMELGYKTLKDDFDSAYTLFRIRTRVEDNNGDISREDLIKLLELANKSLELFKDKIEEIEKEMNQANKDLDLTEKYYKMMSERILKLQTEYNGCIKGDNLCLK